METNITELKTLDDYQNIINSGNLVVIDFTAQWCPPCQKIKPKYHALAKDSKYRKVAFCTIDVDANKQAMIKAGIECMPTFQFYIKGSMVDKLEGANYYSLVAKVEKHNVPWEGNPMFIGQWQGNAEAKYPLLAITSDGRVEHEFGCSPCIFNNQNHFRIETGPDIYLRYDYLPETDQIEFDGEGPALIYSRVIY